MLQGARWQRQVAPAHGKTTLRAGRGLNTVGNRRAELSTKAAEAILRRTEGQPSPEDLRGSLLPMHGGALDGTRSSTHPHSYSRNKKKNH